MEEDSLLTSTSHYDAHTIKDCAYSAPGGKASCVRKNANRDMGEQPSTMGNSKNIGTLSKKKLGAPAT